MFTSELTSHIEINKEGSKPEIVRVLGAMLGAAIAAIVTVRVVRYMFKGLVKLSYRHFTPISL